jgi:hypothetical protein
MTSSLALGALLIVLGVFVGCGSDEVVGSKPAAMPLNNTPENTILRFIAAYEQMDTTAYGQLFTGDFMFEFSNSADPDLANEYSAGWFKEDERFAATNLFNGGVNNDGVYQDGARIVELDFTQMAPLGDSQDGRNPDTHKVLFTPVQLVIQLPPSADDPEGTSFVVGGADPAVHEFFLVRGDQAYGLDDSQPADDEHWYIWLWRDESTVTNKTSSGALDKPRMAEGSSWGMVKGLYR